jgi:SNF2 family DNA or RNA helicase
MKLFAHQVKAIQWARGKDSFACFMEMRTGKSLVCLSKLQEWTGKTLLIAPLSTWYDWLRLLQGQGVPCVALQGTTKQKRATLWNAIDDDRGRVLLINPEGLTRWGKEFFELLGDDFCNCVLDESTFVKNPKAKITKLLMKYRKQFSHRMIMTGTPIAETTEDIVSQLIWCNGSFMGQDNFYKWRMKFMQPARFGWHFKKGVRPVLRDELRKDSFVLSAQDAGMYVEQTKQVHLIELPDWLRESYQEIERAWALDKMSTKYGVVKDIWLSQLASGIYPVEMNSETHCIKVKAVQHLLEGELKGQPVIIFSRWLKECFALAKALKCPCITGNTCFDARDVLIDSFRKHAFPYMVMQSKTACRGLDLSCCDTAIMCSNYWQYEIRTQILARMKHPLKQIPTLFIDIITKDTIDEKVYELLQDKHCNARYFLQRLKAKVRAKR